MVDMSLLHQEMSLTNEPRFALLETMRAFGLEQLEASGELDAARRTHADWCIAFVEGFGSDAYTLLAQLSWLPEVEAEYGNVMAALDWLERSGDAAGMLRLGCAVRPLWEVRGHHDEAIARLERGLAMGDDDGAIPAALRMRALTGLGRHYLRQGRLDPAQARFEAALELAKALGDCKSSAIALYAIGGAETNRERYDRAVPYLSQALAIYQELNDPIGICGCHYFRGIGAMGQGRMADGAAEIETAVHVRRTHGPIFNLAVLLNALGLLQSESAETEAALAALTESRAIWRSAAGTNREVEAEWLMAAAFLERRRGQPELAARLAGAAMALTEAVKVPLVVPPPRQVAAWMADLREQLGAVAFEAAWSAGRAQSTSDAVDAALAPLPAPSEKAPVSLSPRELTVLKLIAQGNSDRAIAGELFLSVRTIEGHVSRILTKLGVRFRSEAIKHAIAGGLPGEREQD
jgi:DNA-binding CsgD family transcriptional regulator